MHMNTSKNDGAQFVSTICLARQSAELKSRFPHFEDIGWAHLDDIVFSSENAAATQDPIEGQRRL